MVARGDLHVNLVVPSVYWCITVLDPTNIATNSNTLPTLPYHYFCQPRSPVTFILKYFTITESTAVISTKDPSSQPLLDTDHQSLAWQQTWVNNQLRHLRQLVCQHHRKYPVDPIHLFILQKITKTVEKIAPRSVLSLSSQPIGTIPGIQIGNTNTITSILGQVKTQVETTGSGF